MLEAYNGRFLVIAPFELNIHHKVFDAAGGFTKGPAADNPIFNITGWNNTVFAFTLPATWPHTSLHGAVSSDGFSEFITKQDGLARLT